MKQEVTDGDCSVLNWCHAVKKKKMSKFGSQFWQKESFFVAMSVPEMGYIPSSSSSLTKYIESTGCSS